MQAEFISWLWGCSDYLDIDTGYLLQKGHPALAWFREVFDDCGPISAVQLRQLFEEARGGSAILALEAMKEEVRYYHRHMFEAEIEEGPSESVEEGRGYFFLGREVSSWTVEYAIIEIGDTVQSEIIDRDWQVWPTCGVHGWGLHLKATGGRVVWWCRPGRHMLRTVYPA